SALSGSFMWIGRQPLHPGRSWAQVAAGGARSMAPCRQKTGNDLPAAKAVSPPNPGVSIRLVEPESLRRQNGVDYAMVTVKPADIPNKPLMRVPQSWLFCHRHFGSRQQHGIKVAYPV